MTRKKVALTTLGCKVNQFETAAFQSALARQDVDIVAFPQPADIYIINTCAVTARATYQSKQLIRRAARANPDARIVITGCYAQANGPELLDLVEGPVCVVGNGQKDKLVDIALAERSCDLEMYLGDIRSYKEICSLPVRRFSGRTRAFLRIQDGCNNFCTYCVVPYTRGASRSLPAEAVLDQARIFAEEGYQEVVLTGIHTGAYGLDLSPPTSLVDLLLLLRDRTRIPRFRISSLEPMEVSAELVGLLSEGDRFVPHLHIPLQSGADEILVRMNRGYSAATYAEKVRMCVAMAPDMAIGVDVLTGFPGEDDAAFRRTVQFLEGLPIAYLHVFPYSRRQGTVAAAMPDQVPVRTKEERVTVLRELDHKKRTAFYNRHSGRTRPVLVEGRHKTCGLLQGFTDNYIPMLFDGPDALRNQIVPVRIERIMDRQVFGQLCD